MSHNSDDKIAKKLLVQKTKLVNEIDNLFQAVEYKQITKEEDIIAPKFKNYEHQDNSLVFTDSIGKAIDNLFEANLTLWGVEDKRRDISLSDHDRLSYMDLVSYWNKKRNEAIDNIDNLLLTFSRK